VVVAVVAALAVPAAANPVIRTTVPAMVVRRRAATVLFRDIALLVIREMCDALFGVPPRSLVGYEALTVVDRWNNVD
jgi:hypothetical protein